jgi:hypothetical protein
VGGGGGSLTAQGGTGRGRWKGGDRSRSRPAAAAPPRTGTATPARSRPAGPPRRTPAPSAPHIAPPRSSSPSGAAGGAGSSCQVGARPAVERVLCLRCVCSKQTNASKEGKKRRSVGKWGVWNSDRSPPMGRWVFKSCTG